MIDSAEVRVCAACGGELVRQRAGSRYCGDACRKRAERGRHHVDQSPRDARGADLSVTPISKAVPATSVRSVTPVTDKASISWAPKPPSQKLDPRIVPDAKWPGMYRIRLPDGSLSDMLNLTRAKDAVR
jgi:hypothetical protein